MSRSYLEIRVELIKAWPKDKYSTLDPSDRCAMEAGFYLSKAVSYKQAIEEAFEALEKGEILKAKDVLRIWKNEI